LVCVHRLSSLIASAVRPDRIVAEDQEKMIVGTAAHAEAAMMKFSG